MRKDDIYEILHDVDDSLEYISKQYKKAHADKEIKEIVKVKVKSTMENLRSCLDYCINDIDEYILGNTNRHIYFPYSNTKRQFENKIREKFPTLRNKNNKIYELIESVQDFSNGENAWLSILCRKTNTAKHDSLLKQNRQDNYQVKIPGLGIFENSQVKFENCYLGEIPVNLGIDLEGNITSPEPIDERLSIEKLDWVTFTLEGTSIDLLSFLIHCRNEIQNLVESIYIEISKSL
ncbi:hypothetical protein CN513_21130 [Bacillus cereus]|uniref:hypothetical protein n=1 Tax=Bacillus cereus TaxID=1396 RepID=UPI000BF6B39E|nr:hypothetical protein [Bacillus cereus]QQP81809.1 hypothetical protein JI729_10820 [Bacillus sp. TK-2]PET15017.1 hypothetical protein CN513_21130 [Bacillus cereus]PEV54227.1 hypothetical protein CN422_29155 [Bacillus cereus]PFQ51076.1 hypothetical protein COK24_19395 [Bacillus cereus]PFT53835.1 hypothetical protein COK67_30130 [Bacillus cereus]